jgi:hypothetical protein
VKGRHPTPSGKKITKASFKNKESLLKSISKVGFQLVKKVLKMLWHLVVLTKMNILSEYRKKP